MYRFYLLPRSKKKSHHLCICSYIVLPRGLDMPASEPTPTSMNQGSVKKTQCDEGLSEWEYKGAGGTLLSGHVLTLDDMATASSGMLKSLVSV